jgi:hypothetical protein
MFDGTTLTGWTPSVNTTYTATYRAQHEDHLARRRQLATLDDAGVRQVLEEYGPVARRLLGKA